MVSRAQWAKWPVADILAEYQINWRRWEEVGPCLKVTTPRGLLRLKRFAYSRDEFPFVYDLAQHLAHRGFPNPERILTTCEGQLGVITEHGFFYLAHWQEGKAGLGKGANRVPLIEVGELLGSLHQESKGFHPQDGVHVARHQWGVWPSKLDSRYRDLVYFSQLARQGGSPFDYLFAQGASDFLDHGQRVLERLEQQVEIYHGIVGLDQQDQCACHRDFIPQNLVLTPRKGLALIDFDNAACIERIDDIAKMIRWFSSWQSESAKELLFGYQRRIPLQDEELQLVWTFLEFPMEYWQLGRHAYLRGRARLGALRRWIAASCGKERFLAELKKVK